MSFSTADNKKYTGFYNKLFREKLFRTSNDVINLDNIYETFCVTLLWILILVLFNIPEAYSMYIFAASTSICITFMLTYCRDTELKPGVASYAITATSFGIMLNIITHALNSFCFNAYIFMSFYCIYYEIIMADKKKITDMASKKMLLKCIPMTLCLIVFILYNITSILALTATMWITLFMLFIGLFIVTYNAVVILRDCLPISVKDNIDISYTRLYCLILITLPFLWVVDAVETARN